MQDTYVFYIRCKDRVGLGRDVFHCFSKRRINLYQFEAYPGGVFYVRVHPLQKHEVQEIIDEINGIEGIDSVKLTNNLPSELREKVFLNVINAIRDGVVITNPKGEIIEYNTSGKRLLTGSPDCNLHGKHIRDFLDMGPRVALPGVIKNIYNHKAKLVKLNGRSCFVDIYPFLENDDLSRLTFIIKDVADVRKLVYNFSILPSMNTFGEIIYKSDAMRSVVEKARYVAASDVSVLICGESGTGKELLAKAIHMASHRHNEPFVAVNCAAFPENLLESELFGYEEGAFTGSIRGGKEGLFEFADKGTLFLDEIGDMPLSMQAKLLRVLQEQKVRRVGGLKEYPIDVRILSATNKNISECVRKGEMRSDLYYRLNVVTLTLPPLRDRKDDIPLLTQHFANMAARKLGKEPVIVKDDFIEKLLQYSWPGNVRELANVVERTVLFADSHVLTAENLLLDEKGQEINDESDISFENPDLDTLLLDLEKDDSLTLKDIMEAKEKEILKYVFRKYRSSRKIGQILGISNTAVINKLKKYGIT